MSNHLVHVLKEIYYFEWSREKLTSSRTKLSDFVVLSFKAKLEVFREFQSGDFYKFKI